MTAAGISPMTVPEGSTCDIRATSNWASSRISSDQASRDTSKAMVRVARVRSMVGGSPSWWKTKSCMHRKRWAALNTCGSFCRSHISLFTVYMGCSGMPVMWKMRSLPNRSPHQRACSPARVSMAVMKP